MLTFTPGEGRGFPPAGTTDDQGSAWLHPLRVQMVPSHRQSLSARFLDEVELANGVSGRSQQDALLRSVQASQSGSTAAPEMNSIRSENLSLSAA